MSDESDREGELSSDKTDIPIGEDIDESGTEQGEAFFDLEAEEDDGYDNYDSCDESDASDHPSDDDKQHSRFLHNARFERYSFPQFSRLPAELRTMIWEAVDPYIMSKGRVLDFIIVKGHDIQEYATLEQQTAPARALLSTCRESRALALQHYPDVIKFRRGVGHIRFNGANDVVLLQIPRDHDEILDIGSWCDNIKYLAFDFNCARPDDYQRAFSCLPGLIPGSYRNLDAIFICYQASELKTRALGWTVSKSAKRFYREIVEEEYGIGEDLQQLYCWPDTTPNAGFADLVGKGSLRSFPMMPGIGAIPVWPMIEYNPGGTSSYYQEVKDWHERKAARNPSSASPSLESEDSSTYESEPDDYALDGFVVDSSSQGSEESSDDGDDNTDVDEPHSSSNHGDPSGIDLDEEGSQSDQDPQVFNGFSPLQEEPSDSEATRDVQTATFSSLEPESPKDHLSVASSPEMQPRTAMPSGRFKRRIVSSDDEDDGGDGAGSDAKGQSRVKKRARIILSDSEEDNEEEHNHSGGKRPPVDKLEGEDDEEDDGDEDEDETEEDDDDDEEEERLRAPKPMSLLARLRQFRSDVPVSPEAESRNSEGDEDEGREDEDDAEQGFTDAEFPESAEDEGEEDGW
jgi:hypothetical protein